MEKDFSLEPSNMPGVDAYIKALKEDGTSYPNCSNHSGDLTLQGFCDAANALIEPFGEALGKAREISSANR